MSRAVITLLIFCAAVRPPTALAQVPQGTPMARAESVVVVPGASYRGGPLHSFLFGAHYRALWTTPLKVPVLRLDTIAGGLHVLKRGGSMQTKSLRFGAADGREYVFRSVDKDPTLSLPVDLRDTYVEDLVHDMISSEHPAAALVVARLLDAAQVLHVTPALVALADDSLLGDYRGEFGGLLGWFELRPTDEATEGIDGGFAGSARILSSDKLIERLEQHPDESVNARALLTARLLDIFVGDWDRHPDQWRWARGSDAPSDRWLPIPRDRDWALVKLDGVVWSLARFVYPYPQFVSFERAYPDLVWLTWNGRVLDRRFLSALEKPAWDSVAAALRARLTDSVIDDAVRRMPPELYAINGAKLTRTLELRRDHLTDVADRFYSLLADEAEVHAYGQEEIVSVTRLDEHRTDVAIHRRRKAGAPRAQPVFERHFDARETREIRIYLHGANDSVDVEGPAGRTLVRVIGGSGGEVYVDTTANASTHRVVFYGDSTSRIVGVPSDLVDRRPYRPPPTKDGWTNPSRDWGSRWRPYPWFGYSPDIGLFLGGGPLWERYAFRDSPYAFKMMLRVGYATGANRWRAEYDADFRRSNSSLHATVFARASGLDVVQFFGIGNETTTPEAASYYKIEQKQLALEPLIVTPLAPQLTLALGPTFKRVITSSSTADRLIGAIQPYGSGSFGQMGARLRLVADTRDVPENARSGVLVSTQASAYPALWSVRSAFADLRTTASTYLTGPTRLSPTLALRVGGDKLWGDYPFSEAAFVGGGSTVRGWREQRYAGDASLYGNAEVRIFLRKFFFPLPGDLGAFSLADAGRVYRAGEHSDVWHSALGGGLWAAFLGRANTLSVSYAHGREGSGFYFRSGLLY